MKNRFLVTASAFVLALSFACTANAGCDGIYLAGRGGVVKHKFDKSLNDAKSFDDSAMLSGALGYRYGYFRTELEYVWRNETKQKTEYGYSSELETSSYMWNVYWDLSPYTWFTPYFSAGVGVSKIHTLYDGILPLKIEHEKFTWSLGGGVSAQVTNRLNLDAGYRYYDFGNFSGRGLTAHEIYGGVRYVF